jgi:glucoamylase
MESLEQWLEQQYRRAAPAMLRSVSPLEVRKSRPGFGQSIRASRGAIVASPVLAAYDPDPDYFFHWYRDSAVVIDALRLLFEDGLVPEAPSHFADFVRFGLELRSLDGRALVAKPSWRAVIASDFAKFVRDDADLAAVHGDAVSADTRVNADGTLDISRWARPQHDGPALRALAVLRWMHSASVAAPVADEAVKLLQMDLNFAFLRARQPCFDIWEEDNGLHYYTLCVTAAALEEGADWLASSGNERAAHTYRTEVGEIRRTLEGFWLADEGYYRSRILASGERSPKELDIAVILAAIHAGGSGKAHTVRDPRMHATLARLESLFDSAYPINHGRAADTGPALGRYSGDLYYSGGAYYFSTLGAAEFCYRAAAEHEPSCDWVRRGDAYLATVRAYTPASGEMSEQFDQRTGAQTSAKHLAWSYAAFISCVAARRAAVSRS